MWCGCGGCGGSRTRGSDADRPHMPVGKAGYSKLARDSMQGALPVIKLSRSVVSLHLYGKESLGGTDPDERFCIPITTLLKTVWPSFYAACGLERHSLSIISDEGTEACRVLAYLEYEHGQAIEMAESWCQHHCELLRLSGRARCPFLVILPVPVHELRITLRGQGRDIYDNRQ